MLPASLKRSYGNKAERYGERIVAEAKQDAVETAVMTTFFATNSGN